jgi:hypothetical protein
MEIKQNIKRLFYNTLSATQNLSRCKAASP